VDGHHFGVHGEWHVGIVAAASAFEWDEGVLRLLRLLLWFVLLLLQLLLQTGNRWSIECTLGNAAMFESSTVEAWFVVIVALADDLPTVHDDTAMLIMQRGLGSLLEAERQISVSLHFAC
jgi:hypothetical protein